MNVYESSMWAQKGGQLYDELKKKKKINRNNNSPYGVLHLSLSIVIF